MPSPNPILAEIVSSFVESAERGGFNGIVASSLLHMAGDEESLRSHLSVLVGDRKIDCIFASRELNIHIKRFPEPPVNEQQLMLKTEDLGAICLYPTGSEVARDINDAYWNDRPFSKALLLAEPQLSFRSFEMGALERYTGDPRYTVHFEDYMGSMSIDGESFSDGQFPVRHKVSLQTFGLGFSDQKLPYIVVYLRYLAELSPEHQQYWNSYLVTEKVRMCRQYYQSSILGEFWENRSIRYAITEELKIINELSNAIWKKDLFRDVPKGDVPIGLTSFLRPTEDNHNRFVMALDKLISENINVKFFKGKVELEAETVRPDGKIVVNRKGSLRLLEEWLSTEIIWEDLEKFRKTVIAPLRAIRKLRQAPAHKFTTDQFSTEYYNKRKRMMCDVFNSLSNIRLTLSKHSRARDIVAPAWLDDDKIHVF